MVMIVGIGLLGLLGFSATFGFVFFGEQYYQMAGRDWAYIDGMRKFHEFQADYARKHDGKFLAASIDSLPPECSWLKSRGNVTAVSIDYGADLKTYEVRITPTAFFAWPYNHISKRVCYYMNQTGKIRHEQMTGPGDGATRTSPILQ
jgi:hypothetical protein